MLSDRVQLSSAEARVEEIKVVMLGWVKAYRLVSMLTEHTPNPSYGYEGGTPEGSMRVLFLNEGAISYEGGTPEGSKQSERVATCRIFAHACFSDRAVPRP